MRVCGTTLSSLNADSDALREQEKNILAINNRQSLFDYNHASSAAI